MSSDVALVFPPLWYYPLAPPELAGLATTLRAQGFTTTTIDANQAAIDSLLSRESVAGLGFPDLGERVGDAKDALRHASGFFDPAAHRHAAQALAEGWAVISGAFAGCHMDFLHMNIRHDIQSLQGCLDAADDVSGNPFRSWIVGTLVPTIERADPRCVCLFYVHPEQIVAVITIALLLKRGGFTGKVLVLGSLEDQVTFARFFRQPQHPEWTRLASLIDGVIGYEAEPALPVILRALRKQGSLPDAPNLVRLSADRIELHAVSAVQDLDALPGPDFAEFDQTPSLFPEPVVAMVASRGCYWNRCTFCAITSNQVSSRSRSPERVADDLAGLLVRGVRWFQFRDMLFSPAWAARLADAILRRGIQVRWTFRARFEDAWLRTDLSALAKAGCAQIWFGFESASPRVLGRMDKGTRLLTSVGVLRACEAAGIGAHLLMLHGFPSETDDEAEATVRWVEENRALVDSVSFTDFVLFSGTPVFDQAAAFGIVPRATGSLFQYRFEYLDEDARVAKRARFHRLNARVQSAVPMPLWHVSAVPLYRERNGAGSLRREANS